MVDKKQFSALLQQAERFFGSAVVYGTSEHGSAATYMLHKAQERLDQAADLVLADNDEGDGWGVARDLLACLLPVFVANKVDCHYVQSLIEKHPQLKG